MAKALNRTNKALILVLGISLIFTSCEKESAEEIVAKEKFDAPNIELAKQYVNSNSTTSSTNATDRNTSSDVTSVTHWEGSKTKKYKETEQLDVDILYTPIYVDSPRTDIKGFVASTEQDGTVDSRKFYILYRSNDLSNGLNAYILIYGLDGHLELAYNFVNGQPVPLPEGDGTDGTVNRPSGECDGNISAMTDGEFENWWANCSGIVLGEVVVTATISNQGPNSGSTSAFNDWNSNQWVSVHIPAVTGSNYNNGNSNSIDTSWHNPNVTVANAPSISAALGAGFSSPIANWLRQAELNNQGLLNQIADYLNGNRQQNPFNGLSFDNISPEQFPISDAAIEFVINLINIGISNSNIENIGSLLADALGSLTSFTPSDYPGMNEGLPFNWWNDSDFIINSGNFDIDDEQPNAKEAALYAIFRREAVLHIENSLEALSRAEELVVDGTLTGIEDGKADAFRHAYWNALGTAEFGAEIMKLFADAHEWGESGLSVTMDFHNNHHGRIIGNNFDFFSSDSNIEAAVLAALYAGTLRYINSLGLLVATNL